MEHVDNATFFHTSTYSSIYYQNTALQGGTVYGIDENYLDTCGYMVRSGRGFIQKDYDNLNTAAPPARPRPPAPAGVKLTRFASNKTITISIDEKVV